MESVKVTLGGLLCIDKQNDREERMTEIEKKQAFWKGFLSGAAWAFVCLAGLIASAYYFLQIMKDFGGQ